MIVGIQGKKKQQQLGKSGTGGQLHSMTTMSLVGNIYSHFSCKSKYWEGGMTRCFNDDNRMAIVTANDHKPHKGIKKKLKKWASIVFTSVDTASGTYML